MIIFDAFKMRIWKLTEILLIVLLHLDSIHFYQTEWQSLCCWEITQAKQYLSTILITTKRHEKSDKKDNQHWMKGFSDFQSIGFLTFLSKTRGQWEENLTGSSTVCFASLEIFRVDGRWNILSHYPALPSMWWWPYPFLQSRSACPGPLLPVPQRCPERQYIE